MREWKLNGNGNENGNLINIADIYILSFYPKHIVK